MTEHCKPVEKLKIIKKKNKKRSLGFVGPGWDVEHVVFELRMEMERLSGEIGRVFLVEGLG